MAAYGLCGTDKCEKHRADLPGNVGRFKRASSVHSGCVGTISCPEFRYSWVKHTFIVAYSYKICKHDPDGIRLLSKEKK